MKINKLLDELTSRNIEPVFVDMVEGTTGLVKYGGHWFCMISASDPTEKKEEDMAKALVHADNRGQFPSKIYDADANTAVFLERTFGPAASLVDDLEPMFQAKAKLLLNK